MYAYLYAMFWKDDTSISFKKRYILITLLTVFVFIMYWPLKPPAKQEVIKYDLDFTFLVTTCIQLNTVLKS